MRVGLIAKKIGMSSLFAANGERVPVTLLHIDENVVVSQKTEAKDKYLALQIGAKIAKANNVTKPLKGHFAKNSIEPRAILKEFRITDKGILEVGAKLTAAHFVEGQFIDAQSYSKGKGFAGVMKRWNFAGLRASHGVSIAHRSAGSTGQCQDPGRVPKGKKMAGHLGDELVTKQNLQVVYVDVENNTIGIKGSLPGTRGSTIYLTDALKRALPEAASYPTVVSNANNNAIEEGAQNGS